MNVTNSTFYRNKASAKGGGIYIEHDASSASAMLLNDTFFRNVASNVAAGGGVGGGLFIDLGTAPNNTCSLISLTVYDNSADAAGGGLEVSAGQVSIDNSIFDENELSDDPGGLNGPVDVGLDAGASLNDKGFNLVGTTNTMFKEKTDILNNNPGLASELAQNGAPAGYPQTLALSTASPGYEMGDPELWATDDERGFIRGDAPSIGAEDPDAFAPS